MFNFEMNNPNRAEKLPKACKQSKNDSSEVLTILLACKSSETMEGFLIIFHGDIYHARLDIEQGHRCEGSTVS